MSGCLSVMYSNGLAVYGFYDYIRFGYYVS